MRPELELLIAPLRACLTGLRALAHIGHVELAAADNCPLVVLRTCSGWGSKIAAGCWTLPRRSR
ncbi:hypothetical protein D8L93_11125 [Sodalis-like symbiont of Bactericera trigonica]|nr:hypothetical protein D8L93_11125 [Sodalis-like symbiont of Bactericera trigonica]